MLTVPKLRSAVKRLQQNYISKAKARRFATGINQLALQEFSSLNAAGRKLGGNRWSGESRIRRLVTDTGLADQLQKLLFSEALATRHGSWYCSLDHSQFGPFCIAILAVSHRKGRAIPIWCQVNISEAGLIAPLLAALEELFQFLQEHAPNLQLVLVMDRWFASDKLFTLFTEHSIFFIARTKSDKRVVLPWDPSWWRIPIQEISLEETMVTYRSHRLRLVRSDYNEHMKDPEPWFLLTNLPEEITRRMVLHRYAERFEIEEAFKDIKWLQRLEWQRVRKPDQRSLSPKKQLSWYRHAWEQLQASRTAQLCLLT